MAIDEFFAEREREERERAELAWNNRRVLAERLKWPAGALETCEEIERKYPGWSLFWMSENKAMGFERVAGFSAVLVGVRRKTELFDPDPERLEDAVSQLASPDR